MTSDCTIKQVEWAEYKEPLSALRSRVFIEEQGVPEHIELDENDSFLPHFVILKNEEVIGCARLFPDGKLSRMAVAPEYRGQNLGRALMQFIINYSMDRYNKPVYMSAQSHAVPFYEKQGFKVVGEEYGIVGIAHKDMIYHDAENQKQA